MSFNCGFRFALSSSQNETIFRNRAAPASVAPPLTHSRESSYALVGEDGTDDKRQRRSRLIPCCSPQTKSDVGLRSLIGDQGQVANADVSKIGWNAAP